MRRVSYFRGRPFLPTSSVSIRSRTRLYRPPGKSGRRFYLKSMGWVISTASTALPAPYTYAGARIHAYRYLREGGRDGSNCEKPVNSSIESITFRSNISTVSSTGLLPSGKSLFCLIVYDLRHLPCERSSAGGLYFGGKTARASCAA